MTPLLAGMRVPAGLSFATVIPDGDFETYSEAGYVWDATANKWTCLPGASQGRKGLEVVGAANYANHPTTEVLCFTYDLMDGRGPRLWTPYPILIAPPGCTYVAWPQDLFDWIAAGGLFEAWNSGFEHWIWNHVCVPKYGWPPLPQRQLRCAMAKARAHSLPGKLSEAGRVLNCTLQKDPEGDRLVKKFCMPRNPTKADPRRRIHPTEDPEGVRLFEYCLRDIAAESEISLRVPDLSPQELDFWLLDQEINYRGIEIDDRGVSDCIAIVEQALEKYNAELEALAGCKASEVQQLQGWLRGRGVHLDSLDEDAVDAALARGGLPDEARRALQIRQTVGSASVKKVFALRNQSHRGRVHDLYTYHGARTGRPTGNGPQPTNLPKAGPKLRCCGRCGHHMALDAGPVCLWCGEMAFNAKV